LREEEECKEEDCKGRGRREEERREGGLRRMNRCVFLNLDIFLKP